MKYDRLVLASSFLLLAIPAIAFADVKTDVDASNADFAAAFNRGDAAAVAAHYTEDAQLLPPNEMTVSGRSNIEAYWKGGVGMGLSALVLTAGEVTSEGNLAYEVGEFSIDVPGSDGKKSPAKGKYVVVWKNVDGKWYMHRDMWNDNPAK
jgi:uncharacterized protein (TIGR02246 family)